MFLVTWAVAGLVFQAAGPPVVFFLARGRMPFPPAGMAPRRSPAGGAFFCSGAGEVAGPGAAPLEVAGGATPVEAGAFRPRDRKGESGGFDSHQNDADRLPFRVDDPEAPQHREPSYLTVDFIHFSFFFYPENINKLAGSFLPRSWQPVPEDRCYCLSERIARCVAVATQLFKRSAITITCTKRKVFTANKAYSEGSTVREEMYTGTEIP